MVSDGVGLRVACAHLLYDDATARLPYTAFYFLCRIMLKVNSEYLYLFIESVCGFSMNEYMSFKQYFLNFFMRMFFNTDFSRHGAYRKQLKY